MLLVIPHFNGSSASRQCGSEGSSSLLGGSQGWGWDGEGKGPMALSPSVETRPYSQRAPTTFLFYRCSPSIWGYLILKPQLTLLWNKASAPFLHKIISAPCRCHAV